MIGLLVVELTIASAGGIGWYLSVRRDHRNLRARINAYGRREGTS